MGDQEFEPGIVVDEAKYRAQLRAEEEAFRVKVANENYRARMLGLMVISTACLVLIVAMLATVFIKLRLYEMDWKL